MPWAAIGVALAAVGTAVGTYSAVAQGEAADDAAKSQKAAADADAAAANNAAALEAQQIRRQNRIRLGASRAAAAKSGVRIDDSAADAIYDSAVQGELEALSAIYSGRLGASGAQTRGRMALAAGKSEKRAGYVQGGATLIGGLSETAVSAAKAQEYYRQRNAPRMKT